jgi:ZIP family zinc transporter
MLNAFFWGLIATSSLILGGILASWLNLSKRTIGITMAFGAGVLISAVAYELIFEAVRLAKFTLFPTMGLTLGAFTFFISEKMISGVGGARVETSDAAHRSKLVVPLVLAIILDGVPESVVIGLSLLDGGTVSLGMLVAVFISNLPEAVAATSGMKSSGWSRTKIFLFWVLVLLICGVASSAGFALFGDLSPRWLSFVYTFAGGAILMMLANTMMPEAFEQGGKLAGVFTVLGFAVSVWVIVLEHG